MKILKFLLNTSRKYLAFSIIAGAVAGLCPPGIIALINFKLESQSSLLTWALGSFFLLVICYGIFSFSSEYAIIKLSQFALYNLRLTLSKQILSSPLRSFEKTGSHKYFTTLSEDLKYILYTIEGLPGFFVSLGTVFGCLAYMGYLSISLLFFSVCLTLIILPFSRYAISSAEKSAKKFRLETDNLCKHFHSLTRGIKDLLINYNKKRAFLCQLLEPSFKNLKEEHTNVLLMVKFLYRLGELGAFLILGCIVFLFPGFSEIDSNSLRGFVLTSLLIIKPASSLIDFVPRVLQTNISLNHIEQMGLTPLDTNTSQLPEIIPFSKSQEKFTVVLKDVSHKYYHADKDENFSLGPLSLKFEPGEVTFLTGGNGSGKTTLVKLLCGLYTPEEGKVFCENAEVTQDNIESYRQNFSVTFSDYFLFENLFWMENSNLEQRVEAYLSKFHLSNKVTIKDSKFSTIDLSDGQRKRLALLLAFLEDKPFYIFDEWAADQDPIFKNLFYKEIIWELKKMNKVVLVITHDDSYFDVADRIIKIEEGEIISDKKKSDTSL